MMPIFETLRGRCGYSQNPLNPPPAEMGQQVLVVEVTTGCNHNRCTFCDLYKNVRYQERSPKEIKAHVDNVIGFYRDRNLLPPRRIYLAGGNALAARTATLSFASEYALEQLYKYSGKIPTRVAIYGNTNSIIDKTVPDMSCLARGEGLPVIPFVGKKRIKLVYWGVESGSSEVLEIAEKGYGKNEISRAASILKISSMESSVMIMPGLGGKSLWELHVAETIEVLNMIRPRWITFMDLEIRPNTPYQRWIVSEERNHRNRRLTPSEMLLQTSQIIEGLNFQTTVGIYGSDVLYIGAGPVSIGNTEINGTTPAKKLASTLKCRSGLT